MPLLPLSLFDLLESLCIFDLNFFLPLLHRQKSPLPRRTIFPLRYHDFIAFSQTSVTFLLMLPRQRAMMILKAKWKEMVLEPLNDL